ncbi:hypothetical protein [Photorhabdus tasmaniensis]|nr:hypothetical protein [Photorhabdus tasmaniensis]
MFTNNLPVLTPEPLTSYYRQKTLALHAGCNIIRTVEQSAMITR